MDPKIAAAGRAGRAGAFLFRRQTSVRRRRRSRRKSACGQMSGIGAAEKALNALKIPQARAEITHDAAELKRIGKERIALEGGVVRTHEGD